ncbi:hypothetical protein [Mangrovihabitans endophyticus]|uniref:Uncharacterized protein n=1 Tax=Mangrovihabitans endophyticus TaxID=1751298 RepID=A0A8J3C8I1_9ACTN|nr:hypothetical protein [Mangrovihabitans endophyticus]GGL19820.1 hypothetical protein GCM10012284_63030 [Mangrovihabitans endophyticus]
MSEVRVALIGVDGSGKTTVARGVPGVAVVHAIRPHEDPASPYADVSRHLAAASAVADEVGRAQLKVAVLYLQLGLYGPAERASAGRDVLADRHPLIDPLVYLPLYARLGVDPGERGDTRRWWAAMEPATAAAVRETLAGTDPWELGGDLIRLAAKPPGELLAELVRLFDVGLPDAVVLLDLPVEQALARTRGRTRGNELHETTAVLGAARTRYAEVLDWLAGAHPGVAQHRVDCADRPVRDVIGEVAGLMGH